MGHTSPANKEPLDEMNPDILIRNAEQEDVDTLVELLKALFSIEKDFTFNAQRQRRGLNLMLRGGRKHHCIKIAELNGRVVGMCTVQLLVSTAEGSMVGLVEDMIVDARFRGQCIGRLLMEHIEAWARGRDITRLQLLTDRTNFAAMGFYNSIGWDSTKLICLRRKWRQKK